MAEAATLPDRFEAIARRYPERLAVQDLERALSYAELSDQVRRIARAVAGLGGAPGPIALLAPLDHRFVAAFLGAMAAGRTVLPLDPDHPAERNRRIAAHAGATAAIVAPNITDQAGTLFEADLPRLDLGRLEDAREAVPRQPGPHDPAYILYTSGSTGAPKGVVHSHAGGLGATAALARACELTFASSIGVFFAGTVTTIAVIEVALLNGAALHVLPAVTLGTERLVEEIRTRRLSVLHMVPTLLRRVAEAACQGERPDSVKLVRLMGDRSEWSDVDLIRRAFGPESRIAVGIASTEAPISYAGWQADEKARAAGSRLPVGRPSPGMGLMLMGEDGAPAPDGEPGEAVVSSPHLALGYWREPELTAQAFRVDPADPEVRIFATGDICRRRPDGLIEFVGRKDQLVKLRGHRIEPGEVEAALRQCSGVADAAIVVRRAPDGRPRALAAYIEPRPGETGLLPRHVAAMAAQKLPAHMTPSIVYVEALPRLPNFKIDRQALLAADQWRAGDLSARAQDPLLDKVAAAFEAVVGWGGATPEDDLLSLGGDSLQAVMVMAELEERLGVIVPHEVFNGSRSIAGLTAWIARQLGEPA